MPENFTKISIYEYTLPELEKITEDAGYKKSKARILFDALYRRHIYDFSDMLDLPTPFIKYLNEKYIIDSFEILDKQESTDGTIKILFGLSDGSKAESVIMPFEYGTGVCVTSQIGCNMGCKFCASGLLKKKRNCTSAEMVGQVVNAEKILNSFGKKVSNVVVMGTGEPFDNYDEVIKFLNIINDDRGLAVASRRITVSTCGIVPRIYDFAGERYNLAISLHAPNNPLRNELMPINRSFPLEKLKEALTYYTQNKKRKITLEYILLKDVNDKAENAVELAEFARGIRAYVNLIPYNPVTENDFSSSDYGDIKKFYDTLMKNGIKATLRGKHGEDIDAACGQLRVNYERQHQGKCGG